MHPLTDEPTEKDAVCDGPMCEPPIPDNYKLDALDMISALQAYDSGYKIEYLRGSIERTARWLMERDKRWTQR